MSTSRELEMISAYLDGEVPEPYRGRMPAFLEAENYRGEAYRRYESVQAALRQQPEGDVGGAQDRVWSELQRRLKPRQPSFVGLAHESWWRRAVHIPLPAAAAVAIAFLGVAFFGFRSPAVQQVLPEYQSRPEAMSVSAADFGLVAQPDFGPRFSPALGRSLRVSGDTGLAAEAQFGSDLQLRVQVDSFAQLLEILAAQNLVRDVTINLPQDSRFGIHGEPALMRASDVGNWGIR
ncbi:hypothetical protein [Spirochaeta africana]|uniref:Uncharacterized protein n=1 Tax=Spirochaeta africana (strain ATCC 700263 / DSM 8902 / Z-7692) TaxID=889378 RepID=H9ULX6_SPIAZ|nr:hypothetical protein [Spirochaeta africana]AFG38519.1 hypothetical protein Spiaf_2488 [Spirochaeta africana DSM 8902]